MCSCFWGARYKVHFFHFVITMLSALSMNITFFVFIYLASFFFCFSFCAPVLVDNVGSYVRNVCVFGREGG